MSAVVEYDMDELEARAYSVVLLWDYLSRRSFPDYQHARLPKGDPRKSLIFKYCYKFVRETQGIVAPEEYKLYVRAQLDILKAINIGKAHPLIGPHVLAGDKAWVRWKLWKRKYEAIRDKQDVTETSAATVPADKVKKELDKTHTFLCAMFGGTPSEDQYRLNRPDLEKWLSLGKVSPYYALISPWFKRYCKAEDVDLGVFQNSVTEECVEYFKKNFGYEVL